MSQFFRRYLARTLFLLALPLLFAAHGLIDPLLYTPQLSCYPGETLTFTVQLPETAPSEVSFSLPSLPEGVKLISAKKTSRLLNAQVATVVELVLQFDKDGSVHIPDIVFALPLKQMTVAIPEITVLRRQAFVPPSVFWGAEQTGPYVAGNPVTLRLYVSGADILQGLSFTLPENILFDRKDVSSAGPAPETEIYLPEARELPDGTFASPAGEFTWTPLLPGASVPVAKAVLVAGDGKTFTVTSDPFVLEILPASSGVHTGRQSAAVDAPTDSLGRAFLPSENAAMGESGPVDSDLLVRSLHAARLKERSSLFVSAENRLAIERRLGITESLREPPRVLILPLFCVCALCLAGFAAAALLRRRFAAVLLCAAVLCGAAAISLWFASHVPRALVLDGRLKTVPETSASIRLTLPAGKRVRIRTQNGGWVFVESDIDGRSGWLETTQILEL